ncbi:hypothetical protein [Streptomyces lavendofoliae]|uniref:hypothetical protein n=1 Tax=Streptomyces lavendofoliae TaxID=67314 RepID=UPI003D8FE118
MTVDTSRPLAIAAGLVMGLSTLAAPAYAATSEAGPAADRSRSCHAIDSYAPNKNEEHTVAIVDGRAYAGEWVPHLKTVVWQDLSDNKGYPSKACDITISEQGNKAWIKAITTDGQVYETTCNTTGTDFTCNDRWTKLGSPAKPTGTTSRRTLGD